VKFLLDVETRKPLEPATLLLRARTLVTDAEARTGVAVFGLLLVLAVAVGTDRVMWRIGGTNVRVELVAGLLALSAALLYYRRRALAAIGTVEVLLIAWLGLNVLSSAAFSPSPTDSLRSSLVLGGLVAIYLSVVLLVRGRSAGMWAVWLWVVTGAAVSLIALLDALFFSMFGSTRGMSLHRAYSEGVLTVVPMVTGTIWEPNLFGAFALGAGLIGAALALAPASVAVAGRGTLLVCVALCFSGVVLSMTRTVWLVGLALSLTLAGAGVILALRRGDRLVHGWHAAVLAGAIVGAAVAWTLPRVSWATPNPWELSYLQLEDRVRIEVRSMRQGTGGASLGGSALAGRIDELGSWESAPTLLARQSANERAIGLWQERPWLGWGTDAFRHAAHPTPHAPAWIPNVVLHVLFDTGIVGLLLLGVGALLAAGRAVRVLARPVRSWHGAHYALLGLVVACSALAICYQMTDGTWMGFTWFVYALLVASTRTATLSETGP
jgi:hypothetical protein